MTAPATDRPLIRVRTFIVVVAGFIAWLAGDEPSWCAGGAWSIANFVEGGLWLAAAFFTVRRKPGKIRGIVKVPPDP